MMVKMVAFVDVSVNNPCIIQTVSLKGYEFGSQMFMKSNGIPELIEKKLRERKFLLVLG